MEWEQIKINEDGSSVIPTTWLYPHYYEAFSILFRFENVLRIFTYTVLKTFKGKDWQSTTVNFNNKTIGSISTIAAQRINQEKDMGYIGYHIHSPIMQLTAGELVSIIFGESNWSIFNTFFLGKKEVIKNKFLEIIEIRNALAHFRPIKAEDIQIIKQNITHIFSEIDKYLAKITSIRTIVPTNNCQDWYKRLAQYKFNNTIIRCFQSNDELFSKINIEYNCPSIIFRKQKNTVFYKTIKLHTSNLLKRYPELYANCLFVTESSYASVDNSENYKATKNVNFIFQTKGISKFDNFFLAIEESLQQIDIQTSEIIKEPTAQGDLVKWVVCHSNKHETWWSVDYSELRNEVKTDDVIEYWGDIFFDTNIITSISKYPWMPVNICNDFPF